MAPISQPITSVLRTLCNCTLCLLLKSTHYKIQFICTRLPLCSKERILQMNLYFAKCPIYLLIQAAKNPQKRHNVRNSYFLWESYKR